MHVASPPHANLCAGRRTPSSAATRNVYVHATGVRSTRRRVADLPPPFAFPRTTVAALTTSSARRSAPSRAYPSWSYTQTCRMPASAAHVRREAIGARHRDASSGSLTTTARTSGGGGGAPSGPHADAERAPSSHTRRSFLAQNPSPRLGSRCARPSARNAASSAARPNDRAVKYACTTHHSHRVTAANAHPGALAGRCKRCAIPEADPLALRPRGSGGARGDGSEIASRRKRRYATGRRSLRDQRTNLVSGSVCFSARGEFVEHD